MRANLNWDQNWRNGAESPSHSTTSPPLRRGSSLILYSVGLSCLPCGPVSLTFPSLSALSPLYGWGVVGLWVGFCVQLERVGVSRWDRDLRMKFRATDNTKTDTLIGWGLFPERFKVLTGISHLYNKHLKSYLQTDHKPLHRFTNSAELPSSRL